MLVRYNAVCSDQHHKDLSFHHNQSANKIGETRHIAVHWSMRICCRRHDAQTSTAVHLAAHHLHPHIVTMKHVDLYSRMYCTDIDADTDACKDGLNGGRQ